MMLSARHRSVSQAVKYKRDALFTLNVAKKHDRNLTQVVPTWKSIVCLDLQMGRAINTKGSLAYKPLNDLAEYFVDHLCGCHGQTNVIRVVQSVMNFNKPTTTYDSIREFCSSNLSADNSRQLIQLIDTFAMELRCKLAQNDSDVGVLNTTPNDEKMGGYIDTKQTLGSSKRKRGGTFDFEGRHSLRKVPDHIAKLKQIINYHEQILQDYSQMTEPARVFALTTLIPVVLCLKHHCQGDEATFLTRWAPFNHSNFIKKCCNGLDVYTKDFASLPPHFVGQVLNLHEWETILPGYIDYYPSSFRTAIPFMLASLVWHQNWLRDTLDEKHPLFFSPVWISGLLPQLIQRVEVGCLSNEMTKMKATGIPPHVVISDQISTLQQQMREILSSINDMPSSVAEAVLSRLRDVETFEPSDGLAPSIVDQLCSKIVHELQKLNQQNVDNSASRSSEPHPSLPEVNPPWWSKENQSQIANVTCPRGKLFDMWNLWWGGLPTQKLPPLRLRSAKDFSRSVDRVSYSKLSKVMKTLLSYSDVNPIHVPGLDNPSRAALFVSCVDRLATDLNIGTKKERKLDEMMHSTLYALIVKHEDHRN
ncbi:hypothetical protein AeRB84_005073 [Aphanomyces euteiches]|nr:hypothetical protein AeRB84_005073 [Aphanomyces euteiches]